jgi:hypothetical protein
MSNVKSLSTIEAGVNCPMDKLELNKLNKTIAKVSFKRQ